MHSSTSEWIGRGRAGDVSVQFVVGVVEEGSNNSDAVSFVGFFPDGEVAIAEVLSVGSAVDMENVFPGWSDSVGASDVGGDFESKFSSGLAKSISSEWSSSAAVQVGLAVLEAITRVGSIAFWSDVWLRRVNEVLDLEEVGWLEPAVSGEDIDGASKGIGVMEKAGA